MNRTSSSPHYWRSLDQVSAERGATAQTPEFAEAWDGTIDRRSFLKAAGATALLLSLNACTREPIHQIVPYVTQPEQLVPGKPLHYATATTLDGFATGILVESHEGHPTKIEGNPSHPGSLGATGIFEQATLLDLYDPDRSRTVMNGASISSYAKFLAALEDSLVEQRKRGGAGLRILTHSITSPTLVAQLEELLRRFPQAKWAQYQPLGRDNTLEGAQLAFGRAIETRYHLDQARVIVLLDADCFFTHPQRLLLTRQFSQGRQIAENNLPYSRIYAAEPTPSLAGSVADHRLPVSSSEVQEIAFALAQELGIKSSPLGGSFSDRTQKWIAAVSQDLQKNSRDAVVIAGESLSPRVHALVHLINERLGSVGHTYEYAEPAEPHWINQRNSLTQLSGEMESGAVECLLILGGNPVFDAPADIRFAEKLAKVKFCMHLGIRQNETSTVSHWHVPESHFLESWSDARSFDGSISIVQPLIMPLYDTRTAHELLHFIIHSELRDDYDIVRDYWQSQKKTGDFEIWWRQSLHDGWIAGSPLPALSVQPRPISSLPATSNIAADQLEVCFRPDPCLWDGSFANNAWLQELPKPFTKITWDNPLLISPALARRLQVESGDELELRAGGNSMIAPVWITPGQAENSITAHLGLGGTQVGKTGDGVGFNGYSLRAANTFWASGITVTKTGKRHALVTTQQAHSVEGRDILESHEPRPPAEETLYRPGEFKEGEYAWGMSIDLNRCIGCNACVLACQSENNIPVVGKDQVAAGRDMQWIRIDQYFEGSPDTPRIHSQPVPCMHCENAPCELVCPVGATLHDHEGLNLQVYNRCVGTRYCSNNCPYKVRRFNFFRYADYETPSLKPMRNPNVTVRWRGVMEKCTYCLQRISAARIASQLENRSIRDGEIQTACQQVCPAQAITFGNVADPNSAVSKRKASPLNYSMLGELNTRPRTTYLSRQRNPNPDLEGQS